MPKVFLIDDDHIVIYLTKLTINETLPNLEVVSFEYALNALIKLKELADTKQDFPEFILLDTNMPMVDGWEFLADYEKFPIAVRSKCKLMMYSSSIDLNEVSKSKSYTCVAGYVSKPISKEVLAELFLQ
ncbi:MAG: response regulator [Sediminibacterium sp.]